MFTTGVDYACVKTYKTNKTFKKHDNFPQRWISSASKRLMGAYVDKKYMCN